MERKVLYLEFYDDKGYWFESIPAKFQGKIESPEKICKIKLAYKMIDEEDCA